MEYQMRQTWWSGHATVVRPHPSSAPSSLPQGSSHPNSAESLTASAARQPWFNSAVFAHNGLQQGSFLASSCCSLFMRTYSQVLVYHMEIRSGLLSVRLVSKHFGPFLLSSVIRKGKIRVTFTRLYIQVCSGPSSHKNCNMYATSRRVIICFNSKYSFHFFYSITKFHSEI
jgi:hypothetical protein